MTEVPDARIAAWVSAWDTLQAVQKLKQPPKGKRTAPEPLPEMYWAAMTEAAIYAQLAQADMTTGIAAGAHLTAIEKGKLAARNFLDAALKRANGSTQDGDVCLVGSAGGRTCIHAAGHADVHADEHGWAWHAAGEHAYPMTAKAADGFEK